MKQAALYPQVSTPDQYVENQFLDLRKLAAQRGFEVSREYCDRGVSGSKSRPPGLDAMMADARRGEFSVLRGQSRAAYLNISKVARQRGNGIAESLHLGSGNLDVQLGRKRLSLAHPLRTLKLSQGAVEGSFQTGFVSNQPIELRRLRNLSPQDF